MTYPIAAFAALLGALGVAAAAAAAHAAANPLLASIAQMLMIHAAAILALLALGRGGPAERLFAAAALLMACGVALFAADLAARVYLDGRLFPFAAPIGGSTTILGWLLAAGAALHAARKS